ncbi:alpha/beta-hydrolase [Myriangium duriaei CBS 260.36]|uniref:Alpha/beta-hydrolase n=1 Tax=Myriangium duriaei CBS 260.36 TaxID=1168546 RepID=A0A9P4MKJ3_9PEZI|nr:alpha/beta-hydrolase [Myriangium duriaei CBS 260.36]
MFGDLLHLENDVRSKSAASDYGSGVVRSTGRFYNFSNIRYAAPPIADLRFAPPGHPAVNRTVIQSGQDTRICPQADGDWEITAAKFLPQYFNGFRDFNDSSFPQPNLTFPDQPPDTNEDCLFLDVFVPEHIWERRDSGKKFPVLFWIHGGGFVFGSKTSYGSPGGLLARSQDYGKPGVIYVSINYRLGAFGWLSGPTFQKEGGTANAGLYDQRFALEWVQKHIHLFGGDPDQVTAFGQSGGASSTLHQITAYGGTKGSVPFIRAITQSPGFQVNVCPRQQQITFQNFLQAANVIPLAQARALPYWRIQKANLLTIAKSPYGTYTYGPVVDGIFTPSTPGELLAHGQYDQNVKVMTGQTQNEGFLFTPPYLANDSDDSRLRNFVTTNVPTLKELPHQLDYLINTLYPPTFDGSQPQGYQDRIARGAAIIAEFALICNNFYLNKAHDNKTFGYLFDVFPALHGSDATYTYSTSGGRANTSTGAVQVALEMQDYITSFAETGDPNQPGVPFFKMYGDNASVHVLELNGVRDTLDPAANKRCDWWQSGRWYKEY